MEKITLYKITEQGKKEIAEWYQAVTGKEAKPANIAQLATMGAYELSFGHPPTVVVDLGLTLSGKTEEYVLSPEAYEEAEMIEWPAGNVLEGLLKIPMNPQTY
jgi:hypothetical protein